MVYNGVPSTGCETCRKRRIKCDGRRPTCGQCAKSARECLGYRDLSEVIFRNQTEDVQRRAIKWEQKKKSSRANQVSPTSASSQQSSHSHKVADEAVIKREASPSPSLTQPVEERAKCFFVSHYVFPGSTERQRSINNFYLSIMRREPDPAFKLALEACSLACLSKGTGNAHQLKVDAIRTYGQALLAVSSALSDPARRYKDDVLASVILFTLFENLIPSEPGISQWTKHVYAAVDFIRQRSSELCETSIGRQMFRNVKLLAARMAALVGSELPLGLEFWNRDFSERSDVDITYDKLVESAHLRYSIEKLLRHTPYTPDKRYKVMALMHECQRLEHELDVWHTTFSKTYKYWAATWVGKLPDQQPLDDVEAYPGPVFVFDDLYSCTVLISLWTIRLVMHWHIIRCAAWINHPDDYRTTLQYENGFRVGVELVNNIIASVPYQLGWFNTRKHLLGTTELPSFACGEDFHSKGLGSEHISLMLGILSISDFATPRQRAWAKGRLRYIYTTHGLYHAKRESELPVTMPSMSIQFDALYINSAQHLSSRHGNQAPIFGLFPPNASKLQHHVDFFTKITYRNTEHAE